MAMVEKRGKGYRITVSGGMDADGKQIRHRMTWVPEPGMSARKEKQELQRQVVRFEERVKARLVVSGGNIRFADFAEKYMTEYAEVCLKPTTVASYKQCLIRINAALGHIKLKDLTALHIQAFYRQLQESGNREHMTVIAKPAFREWVRKSGLSVSALARKAGVAHQTVSKAINGEVIQAGMGEKLSEAAGKRMEEFFLVAADMKPLSAGTIQVYRRTLSAILERAVKWGYLNDNPARKAEAPPRMRKKARYLEEDEARRLLELLQEEPIKWRAPIMFDLLSGLRRAELLGLRWQDVDLDTGVVHVVQTWNYTAGKGAYIGTPKTEDSGRYLRVSRTAVMLLLECQR